MNDADGYLTNLPEGMNLAAVCMLADMVPTCFHGVECGCVLGHKQIRGGLVKDKPSVLSKPLVIIK